MKKTALDRYRAKLLSVALVSNCIKDLFKNEENYFLQAKAMEKEQIIDAHIEGQRVFDKHPHTQWTNDQAELYYNETFNQ